jgi:hypothetical protein
VRGQQIVVIELAGPLRVPVIIREGVVESAEIGIGARGQRDVGGISYYDAIRRRVFDQGNRVVVVL